MRSLHQMEEVSGTEAGRGQRAGRTERRAAANDEPWRDWTEWWSRSARDGMEQQREYLGWWVRWAGSAAKSDDWPDRSMTLLRQTLAIQRSTIEQGSRLARDQQRQVDNWSREALGTLPFGSPARIEAFLAEVWTGMAGLFREWGMIQVANQARTAEAWARFWSLPESDAAEA